MTKSSDVVAKFSPRTTMALKLEWPFIYPGMLFTFHLRMQLVEDAEKVQTEFLMLPDAEQTKDARHQMDARMLGLLSTSAPEGFPDFPELTSSNEMAEAIRVYLYPAEPGERRDGMSFICRGAMARYWKAITPADYL